MLPLELIMKTIKNNLSIKGTGVKSLMFSSWSNSPNRDGKKITKNFEPLKRFHIYFIV